MAVSMKESTDSLKVVMIPWLAHGHASPFLELAKKLTLSNFSVYFCSTPIILKSIKEKLSGSYPLSIHLLELNLPSLPDLPPHHHTTNGLPPHLMSTLVHAFEMGSPTISQILKTVNPDLLIYDINQPWILSLALSQNIPSIFFSIFGATSISFLYRLFKKREVTYPFSQTIYLRESDMKRSMMNVVPTPNPSPAIGNSTSFSAKELGFSGMERSCEVILMKSSRVIEGKYVDFLSHLNKKKILLLGPLVEEEDQEVVDGRNSNIFEWLSNKEESSTVFVSFGSESYLSKEEMEELAYGLELSNVNFIWVVRFPTGSGSKVINVEEALPKGFLERVNKENGRGMILEGWAPQTKILRHPSVGGFLSHCGWSSVMESMVFGVPIIAMPMNLDPALNKRLVVEHGVGLEVMRDENGEVKREEIASVIKEVVVNNTSIKKKAKEMSELIRNEGEEGRDCLAEELVKLCEKHN